MTVYGIPPLLSIVSFISLAILTRVRGARTRLNRLFCILCIVAAFIYGSFLFSSITRSAAHAMDASRLEHLFIPLLLPLYIAFFREYLQVTERRWIVPFAYGYAIMLICLAPTNIYLPRMVRYDFGFVAVAGPLYFLFAVGEIATTAYILILLYRAIRRAETGIRKNRLKYVLVGFGSLGLLNGMNFLTIHGLPLYPPGNFSFIPLAVFAVGLFKHDLLDMGILIRKSLIYSCLTALLTCLYAVLIIAAGRLFSALIPAGSLLLPVVFFFLIAFIFGPLKNGIQRFVDRLFDKGRYDYQTTLKALGRQIVSVLDPGAIAGKVLLAVNDAMKVSRCALFIRHPELSGVAIYRDAGGGGEGLSAQDPVVRWLGGQSRPVHVKDFLPGEGRPAEATACGAVDWAVWAFPLRFKSHLNGFLLLGEKRSGDALTREDLDLLETVCSQSALALENALSYQQIDRLNSRLEKKVADRTRALSEALREKERTQDQLIRSESLAAIGQLVAGVAHELNNPLATAISLIQSTVEDLRESEAPEAAMVEDLTFVEKELDRAKAIVRSLLGLSRQTQTYRERVNLNTVVQDARRVLHNRYKHAALRIQTRFDEALPTVCGNFATLGQVALNILQNAIQAVSGTRDGRIVLSTRYDPPAREVVFECADTGPGISKSIQQDIFKPFFTTKEVGQGTGLGLYISHEIVRKHGGSLSLESEPRKGARFIVRLPAEQGNRM